MRRKNQQGQCHPWMRRGGRRRSCCDHGAVQILVCEGHRGQCRCATAADCLSQETILALSGPSNNHSKLRSGSKLLPDVRVPQSRRKPFHRTSMAALPYMSVTPPLRKAIRPAIGRTHHRASDNMNINGTYLLCTIPFHRKIIGKHIGIIMAIFGPTMGEMC